MPITKYYDSTVQSPPATMDQYYAGVSHRIIVQEIKRLGDNLKILDVGCGEGLLGSFLINDNKVHGVEIYEDKVKRCLEGGILAKLVGPNEALPYENSYFDAVTCCEVLEHLVDPFAMLKEIRRVLKKGGLLAATVPNMYDLETRCLFPFGAKTKITFGANLGHLRFFSKNTFKKLIEEEGFSVYKNISIDFAGYLQKSLAALSYFLALISNLSKISNFKEIRLRKQKIYQNFNMLLTYIFGFSSFGGGLLIMARKSTEN